MDNCEKSKRFWRIWYFSSGRCIKNNTENRIKIIDGANATYHTDSVKVISIIKYKTKEKINSAYYKNNNLQFSVGSETKCDGTVLEGECGDVGIEYYLNMKRAMNEISHKTYYLYEGDKFCDLKIIKVMCLFLFVMFIIGTI